MGNVPLQTSWGLENINEEQNTIITKSLKDYMVVKKVYNHVAGVQNESLAAFSEEFSMCDFVCFFPNLANLSFSICSGVFGFLFKCKAGTPIFDKLIFLLVTSFGLYV